ncbi:carbon starvation CstA family protein [Membranihabitans marinus]|uniref:carbon starvation CstA family protein n=1 Tax=Membranihabitans marinus TaxID=1227546 RepID=UPI001F2BDD58|nr:carbon starvation CstA family protein [Membranihabitans marinus]
MYLFLLSIAILVLGYFLYGKLVERIFVIQTDVETPAYANADGVDFMPMPWWRVFLIQFLNIAGLGPIFGAVAGAMWGPVAFLWIALGSVFAGAVHDYFSGMLSLRHNGLSISEVTGHYLGDSMKQVMRLLTVVLLVMVGVVFIMGPAKILAEITSGWASMTMWVAIIFIYYLIATLLPIDKVIGKLYPIFGFVLLFMAVSILVSMVVQGVQIPDYNIGLTTNHHSNSSSFPIFPMLFVTIACGAISGFHATQSPLMSRCLQKENQGRKVFYGAMIVEGVVALIWAAVSMSFFGGIGQLNEVMAANGNNAGYIVNEISVGLLGTFGSILAVLGVVAAPITSGDTAFRSARLIISDFMKVKQGSLKNRLMISIPLFAVAWVLTQIDFGIIWRYFAWLNQVVATIVLWAISVYLLKYSKNYWITLIPAVFMTMVVSTYLLFAPEGLSWSYDRALMAAAVITVLVTLSFTRLVWSMNKGNTKEQVV